LDSGSTTLLVLLVVSALAFVVLRAVDTAIPLLRRNAVRESLVEGSFRDAVVKGYRASRDEYEDLVYVLELAATAGVSTFTVALLVYKTDLAWPLVGLGAIGVLFVLLVVGAMAEHFVPRSNVTRLVSLAVGAYPVLWVLRPVGRVARLGLPLTGPRREAPVPVAGETVPEEPEQPDIDLEEEIGDEGLDRRERAMIRAILHLDETPIREIMVPRVDVVSVDVNTSLEQALPRVLESGHSRLPVYEESADNIIGVLYTRDLLAASARGQGASIPTIRELMRPGFFVPESKRVNEMLTEFQQRRVHLAVVVDEYGGVAGLVTIEDLLEEIVGEIEDEFDREEPSVEQVTTGEYLIDASLSVDEFNAKFNVSLEAKGFDTMGGFLLSRLGRIPLAGDMVEEGDLRLQVVATAGRRIKKLRITPKPPAADPVPVPDTDNERSV